MAPENEHLIVAAGLLQKVYLLAQYTAKQLNRSSSKLSWRRLAGLVDALGLERPYIIGHSGGAVASDLFAGAQPNIPSRMILEDPAWGTDPARQW